MEFIKTLETTQFGHFHIELQVYEDEDGDYLYNISIVCDTGLDIFESYYKEKAQAYYDELINNIKRSNR